jgi:hypothetical protein
MKHLFTFFAFSVLLCVSAFAQVPRTISYQGILNDASGNPVPDGNKTLTVNLYLDPTGGTPVFTETQLLPVVKGRYNMIIGSGTPIPSNLSFSKPYFLGVQIESGTELAPRSPLSAAPYALRADVADAVSANATGVVTTVNNQSGPITIKGAGGTTIANGSGGVITINSSGSGGGGITGIQSGDGTIDVLSSAGPIPDLQIAANAVTTKHFADNSVTPAKINTDGSTINQVLTSNGFGTALWRDVTGSGAFVLPYADGANMPATGFTITNSNSAGGNGIAGINSNAAGSGAGIRGETNSKDANANGMRGLSNATAPNGNTAGVSGQNSSTNANGMGVYGNHSGGGAGVYGQSASGAGVFGISGTGIAGSFSNTNTANGSAAVQISTNGTNSTALKVNHTGSNGNIAVFQSAGANVARIDKTGKGFFNGGTQTSGADVAEAFAVTGNRSEYEPGDVLVIASGHKRTVEKCHEAYAVNVIGVHATKPGVLLTERDGEANMDDLVPMGVVGVLPTKVCNAGGAIKAGDMLVSSNRRGYAMKADPKKLKVGMAIGKALEDFSGKKGMIEVFVNVK